MATEEATTDSLMDFVSSVGGDAMLRVEESLGDGFVRLRVSEAERRQAKHDVRCVEDAVIELLRNARDADARHIFLATSRDGQTRTMTMLDDGRGVPEPMRERIFDARVTSKLDDMHIDHWGVHGRGMALFSIKQNTTEAYVVDSEVGVGTSIRVCADTDELTERTDQSTWPAVGTDDDGNRAVVRGPHNIIRTCCEFALEERGRCDVYLGSAAEVVATIRARVKPSVGSSELLFVDDLASLPLLERLSAAPDAQELMRLARGLGLEISDRTAWRIIAGQIKPVRSVLSRLEHTGTGGPKTIDLGRDRRGLHVSEEDLHEFARIVEKDFSYLADRYYLSLTDEPSVRVHGGRVTVTFPIASED